MSGRTRSTSTSTGSQQTQTTGTGTPFAQNILTQAGQQDIIGDVFAQAEQGGFQGDMQAGINIPTNVGGVYGAIPTTFVPQHTTGATPQAQQQNAIDPNYQPGIDAGIANANAQAGQLQAISDAGLAGVQTAIGSPNQGLDEMLARLQAEHNIAANQQTQALAEVAGAQGAFGGTSFARDNAMQSGRLQDQLLNQTAELLWADQARRDQWLRDGAGIAGQWAGVGDITPQRLLQYGGLQNQNLQNAEDVRFANANADALNAFTAGSLADTNADRAAQEAIAQWEAAFNVSQQNAQNDMTRAALEQANAQTGLNNEFFRWQGDRDSLDQLLSRLAGLMGMAATAPGGTSSGTSQQTTTQTTSQSPGLAQVLGGLAGAALQFGGMGGFGGLFGGAANNAASSGMFNVPTLASMLPSLFPQSQPVPSERRLKTNVVKLFVSKKGIPWYAFEYIYQPGVQHVGVMEDEVRYIPGAVKRVNNINCVDHDVLANWEAA